MDKKRTIFHTDLFWFIVELTRLPSIF